VHAEAVRLAADLAAASRWQLPDDEPAAPAASMAARAAAVPAPARAPDLRVAEAGGTTAMPPAGGARPMRVDLPLPTDGPPRRRAQMLIGVGSAAVVAVVAIVYMRWPSGAGPSAPGLRDVRPAATAPANAGARSDPTTEPPKRAADAAADAAAEAAARLLATPPGRPAAAGGAALTGDGRPGAAAGRAGAAALPASAPTR
jgi:hypothetical protein